jgi:chromosome segregation ATPase
VDHDFSHTCNSAGCKLCEALKAWDEDRAELSKRIQVLDKELKQWQWKCADLLQTLSEINIAIAEYKVRDSGAKADGSRTI